jgi:APA family basic amino acid/polyamine antiporter
MIRRTNPELPRPFRTPMVPFVPIMGIAISLLMMLGLPGDTWIRLVVWLILGMILYFTYGRYHSRVQALTGGVPAPKSAPSMAD